MLTRRPPLFCLLLALHIAACRQGEDERPSSISGPQILALEAEPAEAAPGEHVRYRVLAVDVGGVLETDTAALSYCRTPKALTDNRVASDACAERAERPFDGAESAVPHDACGLFGPNVAATARPPDPDATGGYYQPLRVELDGLVAVARQRIRCPLDNAPIAVANAFRDRYVPNENPVLSPLTLRLDGRERALDQPIPRGAEVLLRVDWPASSAEPFVAYDRAAGQLVEQRESMRASWFVTAGELAYDHTGRAADDRALYAENRWRAPELATHVQLFIVLRDNRGGTTHATYELDVR